jgi:hypothetical protein
MVVEAKNNSVEIEAYLKPSWVLASTKTSVMTSTKEESVGIEQEMLINTKHGFTICDRLRRENEWNK